MAERKVHNEYCIWTGREKRTECPFCRDELVYDEDDVLEDESSEDDE